jgi:hypothetical protein
VHPGGKFRHHPAVGYMLGNLGGDLGVDDLAAVADYCRRGLIARGFNGENVQW